ncbi:pullulanase [Gracilibacillus kekensis]|uniref:pullulanase n=1 Tax=Gracilibacillus kekensis TaxID=1027249 RepID=A0A1M7JJQ8_9BACI|nr:pullulanase [Gracilibacillus kekensis]SHM53339.1 pullulanase, extracellular [Gracilibacillus kekensis]
MKKVKQASVVLMIGVMFLSLFSGLAPVYHVSAEQTEQESVNEGFLRIHYDNGDHDLSEIGAWLWGDVTSPSDETGDWPNGTWFEEGGTDDYGAYIDVSVTEDAETIGLKINNKAGEDITEDISIDILSDEMNEVWLSTEGNVYYYEPVEFEEEVVRVHFQTDDASYEPWGLWTWGDVATPSNGENWPMDAHPFSDQIVGKYGAYVDIPLNADPGTIGFLLVERVEENIDQSGDLTFDELDQHRQIFLKEGLEEVFTNPYFVSPEEEEAPDEQDGEHDITIQGQVNKSFNYNEHTVLSVDITNNSEMDIHSIYADTTALGGTDRLNISPELNEVTLSVKHDITPGEKIIPVTAVDAEGGTYTTEVTATVSPREIGDNTTDWDESIIYFMLTDRFYDGDPSNNDPYDLNYEDYDNPRGTYQGGDFKGVTEQLDYLDELGVNTIWITPIVENVGYDVNYNASEGSYFAYHGYWAKDFEELNPHLGTLDEFHTLIDAAAEREIKIMADVVLNHTGYGLKTEDALDMEVPDGYPTDEDRSRFEGMLRDKSGSGDEGMELSGLPDFITEESSIREELVVWQKSWVEKSTTANGNSLASYRIDTVKHVDGTTWQHFRNELTKIKQDFQLIGEAWGAGKSDDQGYLNSGMMDSLLDFEFKETAKHFVNGSLESANEALMVRNDSIDTAGLLGQFLGSHDEDGFLYSLNGDEGKFKVASSLQMTAKGQPVIYYGEELGQSGANNWPEYDNRYDLDWNNIEDNDILQHYQKVIDFRNNFSDIFAKGSRQKLAGSDQDQYLMFERSFQNENIYVALNVAESKQTITVNVENEDVTITDHYQEITYEANTTGEGNHQITIKLPAKSDGGTALLTTSDGDILSEAENVELPDVAEIPDNHLRVHFPGNEHDFDELGLWVWEDVVSPSETLGEWPNAALAFDKQNQTEYGRFVDIEMSENPEKIGFLINHTNGDNLSGDIFVDILSPEMNEIWLNDNYEVYLYPPLNKEDGKLRVNFYQEDSSYNNVGLWTWGNVAEATTDWPNGAHFLSDQRLGLKGSYFDLPLAEDPNLINFLFLNNETGWHSGDLSFDDLNEHTQIFVRSGDDTVYTNPYFVKEEGLLYGEVISDQKLELRFNSVAELDEEVLPGEIEVRDKEGNKIEFTSLSISNENHTVTIDGSFALEKAPFTITHNGREVIADIGWRLKDEMYGYDGDLGLTLHDESHATLKLWSPSADKVSVILYDKNDQEQIVKDNIEMVKGDKGVWQADLSKETTGLDNITGYYYHFAIEREGETVLALDPYAKSMAAWNSDNQEHSVGKAAIVDPGAIGPELEYANIEGFKKREDAIIYEIHVRDFTSDPSIDEDLEAEFGTFASFVEKLDYIEDLGVTHVQLLPVMSYYFANEQNKGDRLLDWSASENNYNWGYDPQSYFSLTGMYSEDPNDPAKRIEEFKNLIDEIHSRDMGVILDVVYNHTAQVHLFEDLEPNYYHFMNADGSSRESFGGGRLGTTHKMARRILVDSVKYWVDEFKVDGFRFDMMGDHDAESIQLAYDEAKALNPNIIMIGEGWRTFAGDENYPDVQPADQDWMEHTDSVASFSDEFRNELKSGFGSEGQPRFITGGARSIETIFNNVTANPGNFTADDPGDVVPYIAAHDNLTLHDVIAQSIKKDPKDHAEEIHQRIRLGNLMVLTSQGTPFIHAGQEYGRTKQFRDEEYKTEVTEAPYKSTFLTDENGVPFEYPYFIHDSYDATDAINMFDWEKATNSQEYPIETKTLAYTKGLIELRRSTDAFRLATMEDVKEKVTLVEAPEIADEDLIIGYRAENSTSDEVYYVFVNADNQTRNLSLAEDLTSGEVVVDGNQAGVAEIEQPQGVSITETGLEIDALTSVVIRIADKTEQPDEEKPKNPDTDEDSEEKPVDPGKGKKQKPSIPGNPGKEIRIPKHAFEKALGLKKVFVEASEEEDKEDRISVLLSKEEIEKYDDLPLVVKRDGVQVSLPLQNANGKGIRLGIERKNVPMELEDGVQLVSPVFSFDVTDEDGKAISTFDPPVTLRFNVESSLIGDPSKLRGMYLADDGSFKYYEGTYNEQDSTFTFDVDHFSTFTVVEVEQDILESENESKLPDTATNMYMYLAIGLIMLVIAGGILIIKRRN